MPDKRFKVGNDFFNIKKEEAELFLSDFPDAEEVVRYENNGDFFDISPSDTSLFLSDFPDAKAVIDTQTGGVPTLSSDNTMDAVENVKSKDLGANFGALSISDLGSLKTEDDIPEYYKGNIEAEEQFLKNQEEDLNVNQEKTSEEIKQDRFSDVHNDYLKLESLSKRSELDSSFIDKENERRRKEAISKEVRELGLNSEEELLFEPEFEAIKSYEDLINKRDEAKKKYDEEIAITFSIDSYIDKASNDKEVFDDSDVWWRMIDELIRPWAVFTEDKGEFVPETEKLEARNQFIKDNKDILSNYLKSNPEQGKQFINQVESGLSANNAYDWIKAANEFKKAETEHDIIFYKNEGFFEAKEKVINASTELDNYMAELSKSEPDVYKFITKQSLSEGEEKSLIAKGEEVVNSHLAKINNIQGEAQEVMTPEFIAADKKVVDSIKSNDEASKNLAFLMGDNKDRLDEFKTMFETKADAIKQRKEAQLEWEQSPFKSSINEAKNSLYNSVIDMQVGLVDLAYGIQRFAATETGMMEDDAYSLSDKFYDSLKDYQKNTFNIQQAEMGSLFKDGEFNGQAFLPVLTKTLTDLVLLIRGNPKAAATKGLGSKLVKRIPLMTKSMMLTTGRYYDEAKNIIGDREEAVEHALRSSVTNALLELISPNDALAKVAFSKGSLAKAVVSASAKGAKKKVFKDILKEVGGENIQEIMQMFGDKANNYLTNYIADNGGLNTAITSDEVYETILLTTAATALFGGYSNFKSSAHKGIQQSSLYQLSENVKESEDIINSMVESGQVTQEYAENVIADMKMMKLSREEISSISETKKNLGILSILNYEKKKLQREGSGLVGKMKLKNDAKITAIEEQMDEVFTSSQEVSEEADTEQATEQATGQVVDQVEETQDTEAQVDETVEPTEVGQVTEQATEQDTEQDVEQDIEGQQDAAQLEETPVVEEAEVETEAEQKPSRSFSEDENFDDSINKGFEKLGEVPIAEPDVAETDNTVDYTYNGVREDGSEYTYTISINKKKDGTLGKRVKVSTDKNLSEEDVEARDNEFEEIKNLDPKDETNLKKLSNFLGNIEKDLDEFGQGTLGMNLPVAVSKAVVKLLKKAVDAGVTLEQAIKDISTNQKFELKNEEGKIEERNLTEEEIKDNLFKMTRSQETAARKRVVDADKKKKREGKLKEAEKAAAEKVDKAAKDKRKTERTRKITADEAKKDVEKAREEKKKEEARDRAKKRKAEVRKEVEKTKMPEKKVRETISLELKDLLRLVEKGQRNASRAAKDLTKIVTNKDNSVIFDVINKRTFKSLMNQISRVKTNDEFVAASARLNELVEENKSKRKVIKAEKLQKKIKTGINQIGSAMSTLKNVDPRLMTEEVLDKYTEILNNSNVGGKVQTPPSNEVINDFIEEYNISKIELEEKAEKESKSLEEKTQEEKEKVETLSNSISERIRVNKPNVGNLIDSSWFRGMNESLKFSKGIVGDLYSLSKNDLVNFTSSELKNLNRIFEQLEENGRLSERAYIDFISKVKRRRQQESIKGTIKKDNKLVKKGQDLADVDKKLRDKRNNVKKLMESVEKWSVLDTIGDFLGMLPDTFTKAFTDKINPSLRKAKLASKKALEKPQELYEKLGRGNFVTDSLVESVLTTKKRKFKSGVKNQTIIYRDKALDMLRMQKAHEASGFVGDNVLERIDNETSGAERDLHKKIHEALIKKYPKTVDGKTSINWEKAMRDMPSQMKEMNSELDLLYTQDLLDKHYASKAIMRGENTVVQPYYNPVIASNLDMGDVDVDDMLSGSGNISNLSAKAKSSKEKKATDTAHRWGAFRNALQTTTEVYNDYHLTPMLNEVYRAVDALSKSDKDTEFLFNSVKAILKAQIESTVGFNNSGIDTRLVNKLVRFSSSRLYSRYLSKAKRIPAELGSLASLVVGKKGMTKALNTSFNNEEFEKWKEMTAEFGAEISSKIRGNVLEQSIASDAAKPVSLSLEESRAGALINAATSGMFARIAANYDDAVNNIQDILRFPAWRASFMVNFKEETGEDFDINKYESYDPKLIEKIVASSDTDIRKTISPSSIESQSLRSKQAVLVSQDKNAISQALGTFYKITNRFMQGFTFNQTKILQSHIRNFAFYDSQGKKKAVESMMRVLISNMVYNVSAQVIGAMITDLFDSLVGDDDEDEKLTSAVMSQMFGEDAGNYWARQVATSLFTSGITNGLGNLVKRPLNFAANSVNNIISYYQNEGDIEDSRDLTEAISYVPEDAQRLQGVYAKHTLNPFSYGKKSEVYESIFGGMIPASLESVDGFSTALEAETEGEDEVAATQLLYATTSAVQLLLNLPAAGDLIDVTKRHAKKVKEREGFSTSSKSKRKKKSKSSSSRDTGGSSSGGSSRDTGGTSRDRGGN